METQKRILDILFWGIDHKTMEIDMPEFAVTIVERVERTYVIEVRAKDEEAAGDKALAQYSEVKKSGKPIPWEETDWNEDAEIDSVEEL